jgi:hypothetical protein
VEVFQSECSKATEEPDMSDQPSDERYIGDFSPAHPKNDFRELPDGVSLEDAIDAYNMARARLEELLKLHDTKELRDKYAAMENSLFEFPRANGIYRYTREPSGLVKKQLLSGPLPDLPPWEAQTPPTDGAQGLVQFIPSSSPDEDDSIEPENQSEDPPTD